MQFTRKGEYELNEKFISGLYSTEILTKVCEEIDDVNFRSAVEIAENAEKSLKQEATKVDRK